MKKRLLWVVKLIVFIQIDRRFKYLCDPSLVDGVISSEEMQTLPVQPGKRKKSVNFEQPKANKLLKNKLYTRLRYGFSFSQYFLKNLYSQLAIGSHGMSKLQLVSLLQEIPIHL